MKDPEVLDALYWQTVNREQKRGVMGVTMQFPPSPFEMAALAVYDEGWADGRTRGMAEIVEWIRTHYMSWDNRDAMLAGARAHIEACGSSGFGESATVADTSNDAKGPGSSSTEDV